MTSSKLKEPLLSQAKINDVSLIGKYIPRKIIPPIYFFLALIIMVALARLMPISHLIYVPLRIFGGLLILIGFIITASSAHSFKLAGTPIKPFEQPVKLVTDRLYRYSRNPMYLGLIILLVGMWIALGSLSPVFVIPVFFLIIQEGFIKYEEIFLEEKFNDEYLEYKNKVNRWIGWQPD